jgi:phage terminase large subunit-like protein
MMDAWRCVRKAFFRAAVDRHEQIDKILSGMGKDGWVTITDGDVTDYRRVQDRIRSGRNGEWLESTSEICYDPYNATHCAIELAEMGYITAEIAQWMKILSRPQDLSGMGGSREGGA